MNRIELRLVLLFTLVCAPSLAVAAPPAPLINQTTAQAPSYRQGASVQQVGGTFGGFTTTVTHHTTLNGVEGLYYEEMAPSGALGLLAPFANEGAASDLHLDLIAYVEWAYGASELWLFYRASPSGPVNLSNQSPGFEDHPAVHNGRVVWQTGDGVPVVWEVMLHDFTSGKTSVIGVGERPAIWSNLIAWENGNGGLTLDDGSQQHTIAAAAGSEFFLPSLGGSRIYYEALDSATGETSIAYRAKSDLATEHLVTGPCTSHYRPRVSDNGQYVLFTGTGCPAADGSQPLYLNYVRANGVQTTYLIADLGSAWLEHHHDTPYDIDQDVVTWQVDNGSALDLHSARLDVNLLGP